MNLRPQEHTATLRVLSDLADSGEVKHGYRIKRVASTVDKMAQAQQNDSDSLKGLPLIGQKNRLQGNPESDGSPYSDAYCLPTDRARATHTDGGNDVFCRVGTRTSFFRSRVRSRFRSRVRDALNPAPAPRLRHIASLRSRGFSYSSQY